MKDSVHTPIFDERFAIFMPERDADETGQVHGHDALHVQLDNESVLQVDPLGVVLQQQVRLQTEQTGWNMHTQRLQLRPNKIPERLFSTSPSAQEHVVMNCSGLPSPPTTR